MGGGKEGYQGDPSRLVAGYAGDRTDFTTKQPHHHHPNGASRDEYNQKTRIVLLDLNENFKRIIIVKKCR